MEQYIKKSDLIAEIERKIRTEQGYSSGDAECGYRDCAREILSFLDTLEVKDVNLEKEISNYLKSHHLNIKDGGRIVFENGDSPNFLGDIRDIARHFFELGLKAKVEEV